METAEQYKTRLASYTQGQDPITMQRRSPQLLARLIDGVPESQLYQKPAP